MASGSSRGNNNYPPPDLLQRREQTKYRIQHELNVLGKRMDQTKLCDAARREGERERNKMMKQDFCATDRDKASTVSWYAGQAAENERARLIAEERNKLKRSGALNIGSREKYIPSLEERNKQVNWRKSSDSEKHRMVAIDLKAAEETNKELGRSYRMSPSLLRKRKN